MTLPAPRQLFDLPEGDAYLNCAYQGPLPRRSVEAGAAALARKSRPWTILPEDFFTPVEELRGLLAEVIGGDLDGVAITPSVSYGLATAAANLPVAADDVIVTLAEEFPSNVHVWRSLAARVGARVHAVARPTDGDWTAALLGSLDTLAAAGHTIALVATPACHWTDGGVVDLVTVGERCRTTGAALVVDGCQAIGAMPVDVAAVQPDFLAGATYKWLLGPYSVGFLWAAPHRREGAPLEHNWITRVGSDDFASLVAPSDDFRPGARRYDMGEVSNFALVPVATESLRLIASWGVPAVAAHAATITDRIAEEAAALGLGVAAAGLRSSHLVGIRLRGADPRAVAASLMAERVHVSVRGDAVRVSAHAFNTLDDADRFLGALGRAVG
jgi:selenocysteine lyase/cysteine desulfurase